jgi:hypothetical protein
LASGGGEAGRTYYTAGNFNRAQGMNVAAPAKTALLYFASNEPDKWVAKIGSAVYNRPNPGSMPFERAAHFFAVPVTME